MAKWVKTNCEQRDGKIMFRCPLCRQETELTLAPDWYSITDHGIERGQVFPDYVCLHRPPNGHYCEFSGPLWLINY